MSEPVTMLGARLKAERERRNLTSAKAADELHLDGWVVDALEAEDYQRIGPPVYAKGHLKRYAALLELPVNEIIAAYESRTQTPKPPASQAASVRLRTDTTAVSNLPWSQIVGSVAAVLLILGVLWWKPWHQRGAAPVSGAPLAAQPSAAAPALEDAAQPAAAAGAPGAAAAASTAAVPAALPGGQGVASAAAAASTAAGQPPSAVAATAPGARAGDSTAGMGRARLRLSFSADSWVDVHDAAGRRAYAGKGRANSVRVIHGIAPMRVYLGFASGVQLEINDRAVAIGPQFVAGDVARFEAGADGILRRDSHSAAAPGVVQNRNTRPTG